jgi:hypothetical protein
VAIDKSQKPNNNKDQNKDQNKDPTDTSVIKTEVSVTIRPGIPKYKNINNKKKVSV